MILFPRITLSQARVLAEQLADQPAMELRRMSDDNESLIDPSRSFFSATGGARADLNRLQKCRQNIRSVADQMGFPGPLTGSSLQIFDNTVAVILFEEMQISSAEASALEVWSHMTCISLPDIVRWRFGGERTAQERFIGSGRGVRRNTFGRLWWRARIFRDERYSDNPYVLLTMLGEDDHVQITERPTIAGSTTLARQIALTLHETWARLNDNDNLAGFSERELLRDTMKRIRRRISMTSFDALDPSLQKSAVAEIFRVSASALAEAKSSV